MSALVVEKVTLVPGVGGYYLDETKSPPKPLTDRYRMERHPYRNSGILSVGIQVPGRDEIFWGDCIPADSAEEPLWNTRQTLEQARDLVVGCLKGKPLQSFREGDAKVSHLPWNSLRFGISQGLLGAFARHHGLMPWQIFAREWALPASPKPLPFHGASALDGHLENLLQSRFSSLPAGSPDETHRTDLRDEVKKIKAQLETLGDPSYHPTFHFDLHGMLGAQFGEDFSGLCKYLLEVEEICKPYPLRLEGPFLARDLLNQIHLFARLREVLESRGSRLELVADEWAGNLEQIHQWIHHGAAHGIHIKVPGMGSLSASLEAVELCRNAGIFSLIGGKHTEKSARITLHLAMASQADWFVVDPSVHPSEPFQWIHEETDRILTSAAHSEELPGTGIAIPKDPGGSSS